MTNENDKIDEILRNAAQDYNRPPNSVPRDEMWTAIEKARAERATRPLQIVAATPRRSFSYTWLGVAAAAALLIATGVGIGRWSATRAPASKVAPVASNTDLSPVRVATATPKPATVMAGGEAVKSDPTGGPSNDPPRVAVAAPRETTVGQRSTGSRQPAAGNGNRVATNTNRSPAPGNRAPFSGQLGETPYQVATIRHLSNAEALLTAFKTDSRDAKMDAQLAKWARDLLANTRLLLDSPAAEDPQRAKLLGDLELVLAEMVQLAPGATAQDRELVEGSIRNGHVMTRLRSAIPAGQTRGL